MFLAAIFGCCIGYILALRVVANRKPRPITRRQRLKELDDEIESVEYEEVSLQGAIETLQGELASVSHMHRQDLSASYEAQIRNSRLKVKQLERNMKRLNAERVRLLKISDRKFRKESS